MKTDLQKKLKKISAIALMVGSAAACTSGPNTRWCTFDDRLPVAERAMCYNMKYDYDQYGRIKPSRKYKETYIAVPNLKALRGAVFIPAGVDQQNLRGCIQKSSETGKIDCGEFSAGE